MLVGALFAGACAHSPDPVFYVLAPRPGAALTTRRLVVELRRPSLPGYLDRQHIVRRASAERLDLGGDERWGAPLQDLVGTTLADDLSARLPGSAVFVEPGAISAPADFRVEIEISRFELAERGAVELDAKVAVRSHVTERSEEVRRYEFASTPESRDTASLVASMSEVLARLADAIAQTLMQSSSGNDSGNAAVRAVPDGAAEPRP
ncbi:MAG TPA: PqiC family protein [Polyangiaceae bacterium]|nr:PqiC family protein [Polyangiaceae bacterium]